MKVCVIGNSHVACVKAVEVENHPKTEFTFFASPGRGIINLQVAGNRLDAAGESSLEKSIRMTSGGASSIDPSGFDIFWVVGLFRVLRLAPGLSRAVCIDTYHDHLKSTGFSGLCSKLRAISTKPMIATPMPLATKGVGKDRGQVSYMESSEFAREAASELGVALLPQPRGTRQGWASLPHYASGAPRLDHVAEKVGARFDAENNSHMNGLYGRALQSDFVELVGRTGVR